MRQLKNLVAEFLVYLDEKGAAPNTIRAYRQDLRDFVAFAPVHWSRLKPYHFEEFVTLGDQSEPVQKRRRAALSSFCKWLESEGSRCPSAKVEPLVLTDLEAYALSEDDKAFLANTRGPHRLMLALTLVVARVHLVLLRDLRQVPDMLAANVAQQLDTDPACLDDFRGSWSTRAADVVRLRQHLGIVKLTPDLVTRLRDHLLHISRTSGNLSLLGDAADAFLRDARVFRPAPGVLRSLMRKVRIQVEGEFVDQVESTLSDAERAALDQVVSVGLTDSLLTQIKNTTRRCSFKSLGMEKERLSALRALLPRRSGEWHLPLPLERRWSGQVRRMNAQVLRRKSHRERWALMAVFVRSQVSEVTDRVVDMIERLMSHLNRDAKREVVMLKLKREGALLESVGAFRDMAEVMLDGEVSAEDVRETTFELVPEERMRALLDEVSVGKADETRQYVASLKKRTSKLRSAAPSILEQLDLEGTSSVRGLLDSLKVLSQLRRERARGMPDNVPDDFVPKGWRECMNIDRPTLETAAMLALGDALKKGHVTVKHSRRYDRWDRTLHDESEWKDRRDDWYSARGLPSDAQSYLDGRLQALDEYALQLVRDLPRNPFVRVKGKRLVFRKDKRLTPRKELDRLQDRLYALRAKITLPQLLYAVDRLTGFSQEMTDLANPLDEYHHRGSGREALFACIVAEATNIGLSAMADASRIELGRLRRARERFLREDTCRAAIRRLLDFHSGLPMASMLGPGTSSASDGMRLQVSSSLNASSNPRYFGTRTGVTMYSFVSDQSVQFYVDLMNPQVRDATHALDGIAQRLDDQIQEHYTDTHGYSEIVFGLFDLLGIDFAPRIARLGKVVLYRPGAKGRYDSLDPVFTKRVSRGRIERHWDDLNRLAASIRDQRVRPSDAIRRLQATKSLNPVAGALADLGRIARTMHVLRYANDPAYRLRVRKGLNIIERLHSLARTLLYGRQGRLTDGNVQDQMCRATALSLVLNAIIVWNTVKLGECVDILEVDGCPVTPELWQHISPIAWKHIVLTGQFDFKEVLDALGLG